MELVRTSRYTENIGSVQDTAGIKAQELAETDTTTSEFSTTVGAPLHEINSNDAQTRLISMTTKRNMARKLTDTSSLINNR